MSDDIHEVYAVCYATHARKRSENYIFGDPHDEMTSIAYYVWVIKGPHGTFICDTGFDEAAAKEDTIELPVQINGKVRDRIIVAADASEEEIKSAALASEAVKKHLEGKEPKKIIVANKRLVSLVI